MFQLIIIEKRTTFLHNFKYMFKYIWRLRDIKNFMDLSTILKLKQKGLSNRSVAKSLGIDKKTVNKYWNEYKENLSKLDNETNSTNILRIQEDIVSKPKYNSVSRVRRKLTPDFFKALENILKDEENKCKVLGTNK